MDLNHTKFILSHFAKIKRHLVKRVISSVYAAKMKYLHLCAKAKYTFHHYVMMSLWGWVIGDYKYRSVVRFYFILYGRMTSNGHQKSNPFYNTVISLFFHNWTVLLNWRYVIFAAKRSITIFIYLVKLGLKRFYTISWKWK